MAKLGISKPNKSQLIVAGATTGGAVAGYGAYKLAAQRLPITKEINLGVLGGSIIAQSMLKGSGLAKTIASAMLIGITVNAGFTAAADYGMMNYLNPAPKVASVEDLNGLYGSGVEYIEDAKFVDEQFDLSGTAQPINADLM